MRRRKKKLERDAVRKSRPMRIFLYALALAALSGGGYMLYTRLRRRKAAELDTDNSANISDDLPVVVSAQARSSSRNDGFPLKRGSRGTKVKALQQALARRDSSVKVDGQFGPATAAALKAAGYPDTVDQTTFEAITGSTLKIVFNPADIAARLYQAARNGDSTEVLAILKEIRQVNEYSAVNEYYKKQGFLISRTIVTDLLEYAFKSDEAAKESIRKEFARIGLKVSQDGTWSLQGLKLFHDLVAIRDTIVIDHDGNRIPVKRNTILGDKVQSGSGMTWFRSVDQSLLRVPTQDVRLS